jgi:hypothetical protein
MMSISPHEGHFIVVPNVQMAGHETLSNGIRARISKRPYKNSFLPAVFNEEEVYSINGRDLLQSVLLTFT